MKRTRGRFEFGLFGKFLLTAQNQQVFCAGKGGIVQTLEIEFLDPFQRFKGRALIVPGLEKFVQFGMLLAGGGMERADNGNGKFKPLCLMDRHEGHGSLRGAVARIFKFRYAAVHDIPKVMIEKIADVLFQIGRVQDLNMMEIFKFNNEL